ncbi:hypothetical protein HK405_013669 [Cladochytrium tenue]|nr:hypothetical protein HK405_013669 [Cladochytrium tenue]
MPFGASSSAALAAAISNNPLLVKDGVGKGRPSVYDLPADDHVYGKRVERNPDECAAKVLHTWNVRAKSKNAVPALDYVAMNRNSARQGVGRPDEIREFRRQHPVRLRVGDAGAEAASLSSSSASSAAAAGARRRFADPLPHDRDPEFTYGKPTRPSTPVACLMTDIYQREWVKDQEKKATERQEREKEKAKKKHTTTVTPAKVPLPKKILLVDKDPYTLFKLSRFARAGPRIDSWRAPDDPAFESLRDAAAAAALSRAAVAEGPSRASRPPRTTATARSPGRVNIGGNGSGIAGFGSAAVEQAVVAEAAAAAAKAGWDVAAPRRVRAGVRFAELPDEDEED